MCVYNVKQDTTSVCVYTHDLRTYTHLCDPWDFIHILYKIHIYCIHIYIYKTSKDNAGRIVCVYERSTSVCVECRSV